jgi:cell division protein ZapA
LSANKSTLDIKLLGREFRVACPPEERESLLAAVSLVDAKMAEIAATTRSSGERLAVMTALNLAHEILAKPAPEKLATEESDGPAASFDSDKFARRIGSIVARLDAAMVEQDKLF